MGKPHGYSLAELASAPLPPEVEGLAEMLWVTAPDGRCVFMNSAFRRFLGLSLSDLADLGWPSAVLADDAGAVSAVFRLAHDQRTSFATSARFRSADGCSRRFWVKALPRYGRGGVFLGMLGTLVDLAPAPGMG